MVRKMAVRMIAGMITGAVATLGLLYGLESGGFDLKDPTRLGAAAVGLVYALMGIAVGLGAMAPKAGAAFLNVEDADELAEQKPMLTDSARSSVLIGALLLALAVLPAGPAYTVPVGVIAAITIITFFLLTRASNRHTDEMTRHVSRESSALAMHTSFLLFGGWAILAHLGQAEWVSPIALITLMCAIYLGTIFVAAGKRGLLTPR